VVAFAWTLLELLNPEQGSFPLGLIGLRAYWLWWLAPPIIATILSNEKNKRKAILVLLFMAAVVSILAALQFASPPDSPLNLYSVVDGEEVSAAQGGVVYQTGRARVSSVFSYISGFVDFTLLVPALLLSIGLDTHDPKLRKYVFIVTSMTAMVVPMSGSRGSVVMGGGVLLLTVWVAGLFFTRVGRRVVAGGIVGAIVAVVVFPDAFIGVQSRFEDTQETSSRFMIAAAGVLPPAALATFDYPALGIGTGMMQNARLSMRVDTHGWDAEGETERYLVELGPFGFLLIWTAKLGLTVALVRGYSILKRAGRRGAAAGALSYGLLALVGNLAHDHIYQALYFTGCGFILAEVVSVVRAGASAADAATDAAMVTAAKKTAAA
jgi:hypothetical protein